MEKLYLAKEIRKLDKLAMDQERISSLALINRAAKSALDLLLDRWPTTRNVAVICGSGNNGSDGLVLAALLADRGVNAAICLVDTTFQQGSDFEKALIMCKDREVGFSNIEVALEEADLVVDAILGTGLSRPVEGRLAEIIEKVNEKDAPVLSIDIPSGLCSDTGARRGSCISATLTITYIGAKLGLYTGDGPSLAGEIVFDSLAVPQSIYSKVGFAARVLEIESMISRLPIRGPTSHKGSHGHVLVVGGDEGMGGAAMMAAEAALYSGAGLVSLATHPTNVSAVLSRRPEIMVKGVMRPAEFAELIERATVIVLGPGLGTDSWGEQIFKETVVVEKPLILDADGLNCLAASPCKRKNWILTPHPGEARKLLSKDVQFDRLSAVRKISAAFSSTTILKGAGTLISDEKGIIGLCPFGNPGMAVGGMGDVLAGVIGALVAQGITISESAQLGAVIHSCAADELLKKQGIRGMLATDLLPEIRRLLNS